MIRITEFSNPRMAQAFVDYMATKGIFLQLEPDGHCTILLEDESVLTQVEHELAIFILDPLHPRYQAASWQSGKTSHRITYPRTALWLNIRERAGPVTMTVMLICILVFLAMQVMGSREVMQWLSWSAAAMQDFQIWRWVSHAFIHFSLLHIVFNLMWWWYLGGAVEKRLGSGKLLVIAIISALLSGGLQARSSGAGFGGLSGVVYALIGYCWLRGERDPQSGVYLERGLIVFALTWLVAGYYGLFGMALANMAHLAGLLTGLTMAWVDSQSALKTRR